MTRAETILALFAARQPVTARIMLVAAHPDDETIGLGAQLCRLEDALLVHVTDGAPRDGHDAAAYGFATPADYAVARRAELAAALAAGGAERVRTLCLDIADQETMHRLPSLARRLAELVAAEQPAAVITHAYEGGHPDHDSCAFAVHAASRLLGSSPTILEMALYHRRDGRLVTGEFLEAPRMSARLPPGRPDGCVTMMLDERDIARKQRMIDGFATQRWLLTQFGVGSERLRIAPDYEFRAPPHSGELHYETLGWGMTGAEWRGCAAAALAELGLARAMTI